MLALPATVPPDGDLALVGGTIYVGSTEEPIRNGVVLMRSGKIAAAGGRSILAGHNVHEIDVSGLTVTAGFWNCHVHFFERKGELGSGEGARVHVGPSLRSGDDPGSPPASVDSRHRSQEAP